MDSSDPYTNSRLLYKCDKSIATVYNNYLSFLSRLENPSMEEQPELSEEKLIQQIDSICYQNFKYRTALLSIQKDHKLNEQASDQLNRKIEQTKQQIKQLSEQAKTAEMIKRRKMDYNELVKSVKGYDRSQKLNGELDEIKGKISKMEAQYEQQMRQFEEKERYLRSAVSSLRLLLKDYPNEEEGSY